MPGKFLADQRFCWFEYICIPLTTSPNMVCRTADKSNYSLMDEKTPELWLNFPHSLQAQALNVKFDFDRQRFIPNIRASACAWLSSMVWNSSFKLPASQSASPRRDRQSDGSACGGNCWQLYTRPCQAPTIAISHDIRGNKLSFPYMAAIAITWRAVTVTDWFWCHLKHCLLIFLPLQ